MYVEEDEGGTWAVIGLVLGSILVLLTLYFGGVFGLTAGASESTVDPAVERPAASATR